MRTWWLVLGVAAPPLVVAALVAWWVGEGGPVGFAVVGVVVVHTVAVVAWVQRRRGPSEVDTPTLVERALEAVELVVGVEDPEELPGVVARAAVRLGGDAAAVFRAERAERPLAAAGPLAATLERVPALVAEVLARARADGTVTHRRPGTWPTPHGGTAPVASAAGVPFTTPTGVPAVLVVLWVGRDHPDAVVVGILERLVRLAERPRTGASAPPAHPDRPPVLEVVPLRPTLAAALSARPTAAPVELRAGGDVWVVADATLLGELLGELLEAVTWGAARPVEVAVEPAPGAAVVELRGGLDPRRRPDRWARIRQLAAVQGVGVEATEETVRLTLTRRPEVVVSELVVDLGPTLEVELPE